MDTTIVDALRRATALTRAGNPLEATREIRTALLRPAGTPPVNPGGPLDGMAIAAPDVLDLTALRTDRDAPAAGTRGSGTGPEAPGVRSGARTFARPLGEVIRHLANARRAGASPPRRAGPPEVAPGARYLARTFDSPAGSREYRLYVPASATTGGATGLVMMLHGCKQDPDDFAVGTGMNAKADATGMVVVYPAQTAAANPSRCWNWFSTADQRHGAGEPAILSALAREVAAEFGVPGDRIFVAGLSAGGAMAAILAETYPDVFAAAGIHSGLPAGAASDLPSAFAAMGGRAPAGPSRAPLADTRLIVFHGTADAVVRPSNGEAIIASARRKAADVDRQHGRSGAGRSYEQVLYRTADGQTLAEHWILRDHGHAWSGGQPAGSYTDPGGPDASAEMVRFFMEARGREA